jgi:hypothetical protein
LGDGPGDGATLGPAVGSGVAVLGTGVLGWNVGALVSPGLEGEGDVGLEVGAGVVGEKEGASVGAGVVGATVGLSVTASATAVEKGFSPSAASRSACITMTLGSNDPSEG